MNWQNLPHGTSWHSPYSNKFKYTPGNGNNTVGTLQRAIFLLSGTELG